MPKLLIFDAFTLLIREKTVANYALLRCKTFSLKIWVCKIFGKFHVTQTWNFWQIPCLGVVLKIYSTLFGSKSKYIRDIWYQLL